MIPKIIHYCWFGGKRKPKLVQDCIKSWRKNLPDYEIIEWNEKNTNLSHPFIKEAYRIKKWAFVADYVRLDVIYETGGIYLDADMMVLRSFDGLLNNRCFIGAEDLVYINAAIIGAIPKNEFIKECRNLYDSLVLTMNSNLGDITIPKLITMKFNELSNIVTIFDEIIFYQDVVIYPSQYFYPLPFENRKDLTNYTYYIKKESYTVHLWSSSWVEYTEFQYFENNEYFKGFCKMIQHIYNTREFKYNYFRRIAATLKKNIIK